MKKMLFVCCLFLVFITQVEAFDIDMSRVTVNKRSLDTVMALDKKYEIDTDSFNKNIVNYNNRKFYEVNARLNKYLFLSQVVHLIKYNETLFSDKFCAYYNGPVIEEIMNSFPRITPNKHKDTINKEKRSFLDKIYLSLENATYEELIEITQEDPEWKRLRNNTYQAPVMNLENNIEEYKRRYKGLIEALKI